MYRRQDTGDDFCGRNRRPHQSRGQIRSRAQSRDNVPPLPALSRRRWFQSQEILPNSFSCFGMNQTGFPGRRTVKPPGIREEQFSLQRKAKAVSRAGMFSFLYQTACAPDQRPDIRTAAALESGFRNPQRLLRAGVDSRWPGEVQYSKPWGQRKDFLPSQRRKDCHRKGSR